MGRRARNILAGVLGTTGVLLLVVVLGRSPQLEGGMWGLWLLSLACLGSTIYLQLPNLLS